jgi:hypothetical protein
MLDEIIMEIDDLCDTVSRIVGAKVQHADIPIASADELAKLFVSLRDEIADNREPEKAVNTLNTAIELAFLHSPAYKDAFEIYKLDLCGGLHQACSAYEAIHEVLQTVRGQNKQQN